MKKPFEGRKIGVLMGGKSGERAVSLRSGKGMLESLLKQGYDAVGIDVGERVDADLREKGVEVAAIALHGPGGEDGKIQGLLETLEIPYTGSGVTASALAMDKELTKQVLELHGLPYPKTVYLRRDRGAEELAAEALRVLGLPIMLKPVAEGSSLGCEIVKEEAALEPAVGKLLAGYPKGIAEPFIKGKDLTVGVLGAGENLRALPVLEMAAQKEFYDYEAKYTEGLTELICPARISDTMTAESKRLALAAHRALGCHGVSRVDFVGVPETGKLYILEVNTIPGMTVTSDLPREVKADGGTYDTLVLEILASAAVGKD